MHSSGGGYDLSVCTFSNDGKLYQIDYAAKHVANKNLVCGFVCNDGVILGIDKWQNSILTLPQSNRRLFKVAPHVLAAVAGLPSDGRNIVDMAQAECEEYFRLYNSNIPGKILVDRLGQYFHYKTSAWNFRPFGVSLFLAVRENDYSPIHASMSAKDLACSLKKSYNADRDIYYHLWLIDCSGGAYRYLGTAQGLGSANAKTELEKLDLSNMSVKNGLKELSYILAKLHEENVSDKYSVFEFGALTRDSNEILCPNVCSDLQKEAFERLEA